MYLVKLPQLEAERSLTSVHEMAAGFGAMEEQDQRNYLNQLRVTANAGRQRNVQKPTRSSLAAIGIAVEEV